MARGGVYFAEAVLFSDASEGAPAFLSWGSEAEAVRLG
jgi:hypothetical protein